MSLLSNYTVCKLSIYHKYVYLITFHKSTKYIILYYKSHSSVQIGGRNKNELSRVQLLLAAMSAYEQDKAANYSTKKIPKFEFSWQNWFCIKDNKFFIYILVFYCKYFGTKKQKRTKGQSTSSRRISVEKWEAWIGTFIQYF